MIKDFAHNDYNPKKKLRKDYKRKKFVNPYFEHKKEKEIKGFNTKLYLKIIAGVFIVYLLIYSDLFKIKTIEVQGIDMISEIEFRQEVDSHISSWRWWLLPQKNLLLLSKGNLVERINSKYKLSQLEVKRGWQKLNINIEEKINFLIVFNNDKFFFADEEGNITREISQEEAIGYWDRFPILNIYREITIGENVTSETAVTFILDINEKLKSTNIEFHGFESASISEVTLVTKTGWRAHFDIYSDAELNLENMQLVLAEKVEDQNKLEYIDLRFGNKVFYK
jgi:hypothetical protein